MLTHMLKAKLHMAKVTQAELWYDGSCAIDADLVALALVRQLRCLLEPTLICAGAKTSAKN